MVPHGLTYANVASTAALVLAAGGGAWAATDRSAPTHVIRACATANGSLRLSRPGTRCPHGERTVRWNVAGRPGPAGVLGATGPAGQTGQTGQTGPQGPAGSIVGAPAGGALTGSYPNPFLAPGAVRSGDIAAPLLDGVPAVPTLRSLGAGPNQAAAGNDLRLSDARTPTGAAGGALRGTYPAPGIADGAVGTNQLASGAVGTNQLASGAVGTNQLASGAVGTNQLASGAVGSSQLASGAVGTNQLADGSVTNAKVAAGSLTLSDFAVWSYTNTEPAGSIAAGSCFGADVTGTAVTVAPGNLLMGWVDDTNLGLAFSSVIVTKANTARIRFCNDTGNTETFPALRYTVLALRQ